MKAAGRDPAELEYVGGTRGEFPSPDQPASLDQALATIPAQAAKGFTTICVKPSQFIDTQSDLPAFCRKVVAKVSNSASRQPVQQTETAPASEAEHRG